MRYQQQQRSINKTERQRFEENIRYKHELSNKLMNHHKERFISEYNEVMGKNFLNQYIAYDNTFDWHTFFTRQNNLFHKSMSRQRNRGSATRYQRRDITQWNDMMHTFFNAVSKDNDRLFQAGLLKLRQL